MRDARLRLWSMLVGLVLAAGVAGCSGAGAESDGSASGTLNVVCTTGQIADMLQNLGGEHIEVEALMGPGVDPHTYKATPSDVRKLNAADVVFYNGMHLEGRLADLLVAMARKKPTFAVTEGLQQSADSRLREPPEFAGHYDPHVWHDAALWGECVRYAAEKLMEIDGAHREVFESNRDAYVARLTELHEEAKSMLSSVDKDRRVLVTAHDAFGYFGQAYDVEVHGLQGISTVDEPDVASMERLVTMLVDRQIKAVFVETSVPPRNVQALIEACAAQGHEVRIGGELFSDAMGEAGTPEGTYVGMFRHNVHTVVAALK